MQDTNCQKHMHSEVRIVVQRDIYNLKGTVDIELMKFT